MKKAIWLTLVSAGLLLVGCGQQVETRTEDQKGARGDRKSCDWFGGQRCSDMEIYR